MLVYMRQLAKYNGVERGKVGWALVLVAPDGYACCAWGYGWGWGLWKSPQKNIDFFYFFIDIDFGCAILIVSGLKVNTLQNH